MSLIRQPRLARLASAQAFVPLIAGVLALAAAMTVGWDDRLVAVIVQPPALIRASLSGGAVVVGLLLLRRALDRMGASDDTLGRADLGSMVRGVRLAFLAVAAFAAAAGWLLAHPLPIVVGLIIAGVDVVETSFLLLVVSTRRSGQR